MTASPSPALSVNLNLRDLAEVAQASVVTSTVPVVATPPTSDELATVAAPTPALRTSPHPHGNSTPTKSNLSVTASLSGVTKSKVRVVVDLDELPED